MFTPSAHNCEKQTFDLQSHILNLRSEERRVGKECLE